jgi:hypothetical protein
MAGPASAPASAPPETAATPRPGRWLQWVATAAVTLAAWAALTWPMAMHMDRIWTIYGTTGQGSNPAAHYRSDMLISGDNLQNAFIESVVVDNLRELRNPYLDLREGAAGPTPLRTTSLDVPWTLVMAALWPLVGLQPAYNAILLLSTLATGLAAFGWLRRHTRWPLLAAAGALAYTFTPTRMFHLIGHFNAVMWWAFPAVLWAFEVAMERHRGGRPWLRPALAVVAVAMIVALSGELHLIMYLVGLLCFLVAYELVTALLDSRTRPGPGRPVPWAPAAVVVAGVGVGMAYVLAAFAYAFHGDVQGSNGGYRPILNYAPKSVLWLVQRDHAVVGETLIYLGWGVVALAAVGFVAAVAGRGRLRTARPYALLLVPLLFLTLGPAADIGPVRPYRFAFDHLPFLSLQRVPQRLMVVTSLVLVLLAVCALDLAGGRLLDGRPRAVRLAAAGLLAGTALLLHDYVFARNVPMNDPANNQVVTALRAAGDRSGPLLGVPVDRQYGSLNSATTYVAALSRRRALNAYNQTPAPWLTARLKRLRMLNQGKVDANALAVLRSTGTTQVVVVNEPYGFEPGQWRLVVDRLVASGHFHLVISDGPLALLELTGP